MTDLSKPALPMLTPVKDSIIGDKRVEYYYNATMGPRLYEQYYLAADDPDFKDLYDKVCKQAGIIEAMIEKNILARGLYAEVMGTDSKAYRIMYSDVTGSTLADHLNKIPPSSTIATFKDITVNLFERVLTSYIILYQKTGMIHGAFTYDNIYLGYYGQPIIAGWGMMEKAPCKAHISEFIWFLLQLKPYIAGDAVSGIAPKPWLQGLIGPSLEMLFGMSDLAEINATIAALSPETTKRIIDDWLI